MKLKLKRASLTAGMNWISRENRNKFEEFVGKCYMNVVLEIISGQKKNGEKAREIPGKREQQSRKKMKKKTTMR